VSKHRTSEPAERVIHLTVACGSTDSEHRESTCPSIVMGENERGLWPLRTRRPSPPGGYVRGMSTWRER
jgi:hypothetical protein